MCYPFRGHQITRTVGYNQILWQNIGARGATKIPVVVNLLKSRPTIANIEQHLVKFRVILFHDFRNLVVHVGFYAISLLLALRSNLSNDSRPHWTTGRQQLLIGLGLKLRHGLV